MAQMRRLGPFWPLPPTLVGLSRSSCDLLTYIHLFLLYVFLPAHLSVVRITEIYLLF